MSKGIKTFLIVCVVIAVIILIIAATLKFTGKIGTDSSSTPENTEQQANEDTYTRIRLDEDLSTQGTVKNLDNVRWHNARISQYDDKMNVSIMLNNESQSEAVPAKTVTVKLLSKGGKTLASKDVEMGEIASNYGYTTLDLDFETKSLEIVYNIEIIAK